MRKRIVTATAALCMGILLVFTVRQSDVKAKGEEDFRIEGTTLTAYVGNDTFASIPNSVKTIGESAFAENTTLQSVELPEGLREIGYNAFGDCTALTDITIPDSVTKVGPGAFKGCTALKLAEIGSGVRSWGSGVFNDCTSLDKLIVDEDNPYLVYYNGALYNGDMSMLYQVLAGRSGENYVMPEEVDTIDTYAFWNLQNTKNVKLSDKVTTIPAYGMSSMGSVENVILPDSVTTISEKAFANNSSLKQVMIPASVSNIHSTAFANSPNVKILTTKQSAADQYGQQKKMTVIYEAELPKDFNDSNGDVQEKPVLTGKTVNSTQTEEEESKEEESAQTETEDESQSESEETNPLDTKESDVIGKTRIVNGKAVVLIGRDGQKVYGTSSGGQSKDISEPETEKQSEESSATTKTAESKNEENAESSSEENSIKQQTSTESQSNNSQKIEQRKYYKQKSLTNYTIGEKIKEIGRLSFAQTGLKEIEIPDGVETIEYGAFYGCEDLEKVSIPNSVTEIGTKAFAETPWLENWLTGTSEGDDDDFLIVGDGILLAYRGKEAEVKIPEQVKQIGSEVFKGHKELKSVSLPDKVTRIGADAFRNCSDLAQVTGGEGLKTVVSGAFYGTKISEEDLGTANKK